MSYSLLAKTSLLNFWCVIPCITAVHTGDCLDAMLTAWKEDKTGLITEESVIDTLVTLLFAGYDTYVLHASLISCVAVSVDQCCTLSAALRLRCRTHAGCCTIHPALPRPFTRNLTRCRSWTPSAPALTCSCPSTSTRRRALRRGTSPYSSWVLAALAAVAAPPLLGFVVSRFCRTLSLCVRVLHLVSSTAV